MALTSSLNCLSCRVPYHSLHSLNALPLFSEKALCLKSPSLDSVPKKDSKNLRVCGINQRSKSYRDSGGHFGKRHGGTSEKFGAFFDVLFSLVLLCFERRRPLEKSLVTCTWHSLTM